MKIEFQTAHFRRPVFISLFVIFSAQIMRKRTSINRASVAIELHAQLSSHEPPHIFIILFSLCIIVLLLYAFTCPVLLFLCK